MGIMINREIAESLNKETLVELVLRMSMRIAELERRVGLNSSNSSKPPSSDGLYKKPAPKSLRGKSGKKSGGQSGHKGETLKQVENPDVRITHKVDNCENCGLDISLVIGEVVQKRQVFDIPQPKTEITEHIIESKKCPHCIHINKAKFPNNITAPVQYGARIQAIAIYMLYQQFIPEERLAESFTDLYGIGICAATLSSTSCKFYEALAQYEENTEEVLANSKLVHFDETGMRVEKKLHWLHSASNGEAVVYKAHRKRGLEAMRSFYVHSRFTGIAVHDHWKPYFKLRTSTHSLCNAHILRELIGVYENNGPSWAKEMEQFLYKAHQYVELYRTEANLPIKYLLMLNKEYDEIVLKASCYYDEYKVRKKTGKSLFIRLRAYKAEVLKFIHNLSVPFSNNIAEQDIRMCKVRQKISGCFRSTNGLLIFCRIRGYLVTARKQGINLFTAIENAIAGNPFMLQKVKVQYNTT